MKNIVNRFFNWLDVLAREQEFFSQELLVQNHWETRFQYFQNQVQDKRVLHVGCVDTSMEPLGRLHQALYPHCLDLIGFDLNIEGLSNLSKILPGEYIHTWEELKSHYFDLVIAPEVLEHVPNAQQFLNNIFHIHAAQWIITVPNFYPKWNRRTRPQYHFGVWREIVHPDHVAWYSPYTLQRACEPWLDRKESQLFFIENRSMVGIEIKL